MSFLTDCQNEVANVINFSGERVRLRYYTTSNTGSMIGSWTGSPIIYDSYDDQVSMTNQSGLEVWTSGLKQDMTSPKGSEEAQYFEEGILKANDSRLYLYGTVSLSGLVKISFGGSPTPTENYSVLPAGIEHGVDVLGGAAYKKVFIRYLPTGSLDGEQ